MPSEWGEISTPWLRIRQALIRRMPHSRVVSCYPTLNCLEQQCGFKSIRSQTLTFSITMYAAKSIVYSELNTSRVNTPKIVIVACSQIICVHPSRHSHEYLRWNGIAAEFLANLNISFILGISLYTIFIEVILHQGDIGIKMCTRPWHKMTPMKMCQ